MNNPINAISDEINSVTTEEERNHSRDKPDVHEGETPAEEKWWKYKTQTEKAEIKERRDRQRALEKVNRKTARKAERQAQREDIRRDMTTDSQAMSSNTAIDGAGVSTTTLGTAVVSGTVGGSTATTASTAIVASAVAVPVGVGAGAIITSGTAHASSEHAVEIHPNSKSKSTESTTGKNNIQRMDHAPNDMQIDNNQQFILNPDENMDEIEVDNIRNLERFLPLSSNLRPFEGFYKDLPLADLENVVRSAYKKNEVYLHSFNNANDNDIPAEYAYLRNNIEHFRSSVSLAKSYANVALDRLANTFMNTEHNRFEINHEHPLVKYAEKVFVTTDNNILANIAIRLHDAINNIKMYFDENHDIYFATAKNNIAYRVPEDSSMGFVLNNDKYKRIVILVDNFEETADIMNSPRATVSQTVLHEASHHAIESSDFINSPIMPTAGNALDFMELMNEALSPRRPGETDKDYLELDPYFFNAYKNYIGVETITPAQFLKKLQVDPMLKANVIIDNADFLASMIYDIAASETFPETPLSELIRPRRNVVV